LQFAESGEIVGMESVEGEAVSFADPVDPAATGAVERWLLKAEGVMKRTLHKLAGNALRAYAQNERSQWILQWPGQLVLNCSQVYWTQARSQHDSCCYTWSRWPLHDESRYRHSVSSQLHCCGSSSGG
jgi:Dynein heavy chain, N-terminal region 2